LSDLEGYDIDDFQAAEDDPDEGGPNDDDDAWESLSMWEDALEELETDSFREGVL
jgi:hypothetical protein